jgi:group I intron endonuclease
MYTVYQHKNKINGKVYIGITKQIPELRWGKDGCNYKSSPHFYSAIQKYGWDNFEHNILFKNLTKEEACAKEQELIKEFNSMNRKFGYNSTSGGEALFEMSDESKIKKSKAMLGNKNGLGKPCSSEKAKKISEAQKGKKLTEEHKQKLSQSAKERHTPCSDEKRETLRNNYPRMKQVYCLETDTVYKSVQECARKLDIQATNISKLCKGKGETLKGYHLKYYNDTINA